MRAAGTFATTLVTLGAATLVVSSAVTAVARRVLLVKQARANGVQWGGNGVGEGHAVLGGGRVAGGRRRVASAAATPRATRPACPSARPRPPHPTPPACAQRRHEVDCPFCEPTGSGRAACSVCRGETGGGGGGGGRARTAADGGAGRRGPTASRLTSLLLFPRQAGPPVAALSPAPRQEVGAVPAVCGAGRCAVPGVRRPRPGPAPANCARGVRGGEERGGKLIAWLCVIFICLDVGRALHAAASKG